VYCTVKACLSNLLYDLTDVESYVLDEEDGMINELFTTCTHCTAERDFRTITHGAALEWCASHGFCAQALAPDEVVSAMLEELPESQCAWCGSCACEMSRKVVYTGMKRIEACPILYYRLCCECAKDAQAHLVNCCSVCDVVTKSREDARCK